MSSPPRPAWSWLDDVADHELLHPAAGYRPAAQARSLTTTRRLLAAAWVEMVERPAEPLRIQAVLDRSGVSSSSFYDRFDSVRALVELAGLLLLDRDEERRREAQDLQVATGVLPGVGLHDVTEAVVREIVASCFPPTGVPREVLATGVWSDEHVRRRTIARNSWLRHLAARLVAADGAPPTGGDDDPYRRALTLCHLLHAFVEQSWMVAGLVLPPHALDERAEQLVALAHLLLCGCDADRAAAAALPDAPRARLDRTALRGHSDRHAATVAELREATRRRLIADGLELQVNEIAASVHRSHAAFFDTFGSVGAALADLAAAEQVARIPSQLFRPRADVTPDDLVEHLSWRINAWQDSLGVTGRRLLQSAGRYPEVAAVVVDQTLASTELLVNWYAPAFTLPPALTRVLFLTMLALRQHEVLWGQQPPVVVGPMALRALLRPVMVPTVG